jgi:hypothetical protein
MEINDAVHVGSQSKQSIETLTRKMEDFEAVRVCQELIACQNRMHIRNPKKELKISAAMLSQYIN